VDGHHAGAARRGQVPRSGPPDPGPRPGPRTPGLGTPPKPWLAEEIVWFAELFGQAPVGLLDRRCHSCASRQGAAPKVGGCRGPAPSSAFPGRELIGERRGGGDPFPQRKISLTFGGQNGDRKVRYVRVFYSQTPRFSAPRRLLARSHPVTI
jgi:hypothetical protein